MTATAGAAPLELRKHAHDDVPVNDGEKIQRARQALRLTQQQLADAAGVHKKSITNWETGQHVPRNRIPVLEEILGITFGQDGPMNAGGLSDVSDADLLGEVARRLARSRRYPSLDDADRVEPARRVTVAPPVLDPAREGELWAARRAAPAEDDDTGA